MTGIANYTFHIVRAVLEKGLPIRYVEFERRVWREINLSTLPGYTANLGEKGGASAAPRGRLTDHIAGVAAWTAMRLSHVPPARALYRTIRRRGFAAQVRSRQLDLFHAFNFRPLADPGVPVLPVVYDLSTFRHPEFHPADRVRWLAPLGETIARAPMVQTISEFSKREIVSVFGYPADRIFVAPPAAAPLFKPMGQDATQCDLVPLGLDYGNFFLAVGTLEPRKNIRTLIAAYARLSPAERQRFPLVVAGGKGWGDLNLPPQAETLRRDGTLRFIEGSTNLQLRSLYEGARLLLMPSLYEGFGMPVVEALACGTPVAHSADTAMDEISGSLGRRVSATDVDGWTAILRDALESSEHADEVLREARMARARQFDWHRSAQLVIAAYHQLIQD